MTRNFLGALSKFRPLKKKKLFIGVMNDALRFAMPMPHRMIYCCF